MIKKTIFILGTITFILFLIGRVSFAQSFNVVLSSGDQYPYPAAGHAIPINHNQAILKYVSRPSNTSDGVNIEVLSASIIPSYVGSSETSYSAFGWYTIDLENDTRVNYCVIDDANIYVRSTTANQFIVRVLPGIQSLLVDQNLGTVSQRRALIGFFNGNIVKPVDFRSMLSGWIWAGIAIFIALPMLWILKKFLRR